MAAKILTLRMESDVFAQCVEFQRQHHMESPSEAIRALVEIALRDTIPLDVAFRRAAWRTGVKSARLKLREKMDAAVAECLGVSDSELAQG